MRSHLLSSLILALGLALATPAQADTVTCTDGTTSHTGRGACSHHGGIAKKAEPAHATPRTHARRTPARDKDNTDKTRDTKRGDVEPSERTPDGRAPIDRETAPQPAGTQHADKATARCRDGSLSYSLHHSGTCSQHGGVAAWLDR